DHVHYGTAGREARDLPHHRDRQWWRDQAKHYSHSDGGWRAELRAFGFTEFSHYRARHPGHIDYHHHDLWRFQQFHQSLGFRHAPRRGRELQPTNHSGARRGHLDHGHYGGA